MTMTAAEYRALADQLDAVEACRQRVESLRRSLDEATLDLETATAQLCTLKTAAKEK